MLEPYMFAQAVFFLPVLILVLVEYVQRKSAKNTLNTVDRQIPRLQCFSGFKLPILDGIVNIFRLGNSTRDGELFRTLFAEHGPIIRCPLVFTQIVAVADPDVIQKILKSTQPEHLNKPRIYDVMTSNLLKGGLTSTNVNTWMRHRKVISLAFSYKSLHFYQRILNETVKDLIAASCLLAEHMSRKGELNNAQMKELINHHTARFTIKMLLGPEYMSVSKNELEEYHSSFSIINKIAAERLFKPYLLIPAIWHFHPMKKQMNMALNSMNKFAEKIIDKYRRKKLAYNKSEDIDDNKNPDDFDVMNSCENGQTFTNSKVDDQQVKREGFHSLIEHMIASGFSDKEILAEVQTFLIVGHESIISTVDFIIFQLALNPDIQQNCRNEIDALFNDDSRKQSENVKDLEMDDLNQLKYLERCVLESLRLTPTIPVFGRELKAPLKIKNEWTLNTGEIVAIVPWAVHRDETIFENPEKFDPDRFLPENIQKRHPYAFIPFSMGMRNCIGWKLGLMELKVIMAGILRHFEISTTDKQNDVKLLFNVTVTSERPYNVTFTKR